MLNPQARCLANRLLIHKYYIIKLNFLILLCFDLAIVSMDYEV